MRVAPAPAPIRTGMPRRVEPELLDDLPPDDPQAVRSRQDLQRVNRLMRSVSMLDREMKRVADPSKPPRHLVELGAGDGSVMLRLARQRRNAWPAVRLTLIDRQPVVSDQTLQGFLELGWQVDVAAVDVFEWLVQPRAHPVDMVVANLFLHHFDEHKLEQLMAGISQHAHAFVCLEPRRSSFALLGSHLLVAIGCNAVTRHDAVLSVHAGFRDREIGAAWPQSLASAPCWQLREAAAGLFSHLFSAKRVP